MEIEQNRAINEEEQHLCIRDNHLLFIQAVIRLKSALRMGNSLPMDEFNDMLYSFPPECKRTPVFDSVINYSKSQNSQDVDSGIGSMANSSCETISTTSISYLIQSSVIVQHIYNSVVYVINYIFANLVCANEENLQKHVDNWRGSMMESAVMVVVSLVDSVSSNEDNNYSKASGELVKKIIDMVYVNKDEESYFVLENRCLIIRELSKSYYLCEVAVNSIMKIIDDSSTRLKENCLNVQSLLNVETAAISTVQYDSLCLLMHLLENLLQNWCELSHKMTQSEKHKRTPYTNITEMWKRSWNVSEASANTKTVMQIMRDKWSSILEKTIQDTMDEYPNYCFLLWNCFQTLDSLSIP